ncbi:MAG TPA: hypothetical protein VLF63_01395, partial [Patescibacteria group bacterium]|nr:hypothetical protein [Patescibacteria group bacterium]
SIDLEKPKFNVKDASLDDIDELVKIDFESFEQVYSHYNQDEDSIRGELNAKFRNRYQKIGGKWITILEKNGETVGFMASCPTVKAPENFISWEDITDEGTLNNTYNKDGENVYVVTLSVLSSGTEGKSLLFAYQIGQAIKEGYKQAFFESRLPGLKQWVLNDHCSGDQNRFDNLSEEEKHNLAKVYFDLHDEIKGRKVRHDKQLRLYERLGAKCIKLVPNAYKDEESMNYGVVCAINFSGFFNGTFLPIKVPENKLTRRIVGNSLRIISKSNKLSREIF